MEEAMNYDNSMIVVNLTLYILQMDCSYKWTALSNGLLLQMDCSYKVNWLLSGLFLSAL